MLQTGDILVPRYENRDFLEKPPLTWWVIAASYRLLGASPFAERLPSVLAAFAAIALTGLWVRRRSGTEAGVLAALVLTFTLQFSVYARTFAADSFLTLAVILAAIALDEACRREGPDARLGILAGAALALAFGIKGLVGIALPAGGVAAGLLIDRTRAVRPMKRGAWAAAALLLPLAAWHLAMTQRMGVGFWRSFYWENHFLRGATKLYMGTPRGPLFYLGAFAWSAFPWSLLLAAAAGRKATGVRRRSSLPLGLFLFGFLFFSLLVMKREVYLMPLFPAAAVLLAEGMTREPASDSRWRRLPWLLAAAIPAAAVFFWGRG
ncbi:MAG TPA: glycosyltransferase family 39 protein, partial [Thermoanaerobaculia bacterium]|nr:glycosyltransferase family 39 protein [Thermoanaerobaculia bacterium]